jgi:outer membrane protein
MKKIVKIAAIILMVVCAVNVFAQGKVKLGHINSDSLLKIMPGRDSAIAKIQAESAVYQKLYTAMNTEFETKATDYQTNLSTMSELVKQTKYAELTDMQTRIQNFETAASDSLQALQTVLLQPIIDKAKVAIEEVAKENGFSYIFDSTTGVSFLLYSDGGEDIMPLVKKKLGLK